VVGNKVSSESDRDYIRASLSGLPVVGFLSANGDAVDADRRGEAIFDAVPEMVDEARQIIATFEQTEENQKRR